MVVAAAADLEERIAALRAVVAEAIASEAPRRTVEYLGAAVAQALFRAAAPCSPAARPVGSGAAEDTPAQAKRRKRRGKRAGMKVEEAEVATAVAAAPLGKPDKPDPVYKLGSLRWQLLWPT